MGELSHNDTYNNVAGVENPEEDRLQSAVPRDQIAKRTPASLLNLGI